MDIRNKARQTTIGGPLSIQTVKNLLCRIGLHKKPLIIEPNERGGFDKKCSRCNEILITEI
jgi:hypothetical protein